MEVILSQRVAHLGNVGDIVKVKPGYARNFLVPQGIAQTATKANLQNFELRRAEFEKLSKEQADKDAIRSANLANVAVTIAANAGHEGRLFGSVGTADIAKALAEAGHSVAKQEVRLPEGPIRQVGEYEVELHFHASNIHAKIKVIVTPEN